MSILTFLLYAFFSEILIYYLLTIRIKTGSTVLATTGVISLEAVTGMGWECELDFTVAAIGATGSMCTNGNFAYNRDTGRLEGFVFQDVETFDSEPWKK